MRTITAPPPPRAVPSSFFSSLLSLIIPRAVRSILLLLIIGVVVVPVVVVPGFALLLPRRTAPLRVVARRTQPQPQQQQRAGVVAQAVLPTAVGGSSPAIFTAMTTKIVAGGSTSSSTLARSRRSTRMQQQQQPTTAPLTRSRRLSSMTRSCAASSSREGEETTTTTSTPPSYNSNSSSSSSSVEGDNDHQDAMPSMRSSSSELLHAWLSHDDMSFHRFTATEAAHIRNDLLTWYQSNRRQLPWRGDPPPWNSRVVGVVKEEADADADADAPSAAPAEDEKKDNHDQHFHKTYPLTPYGVWVSEVMLQQTRVDTVINYWVNFMDAFPTVQHLAAATPEQVNQQWAGLGYYRRARMLHEAAQVVVNDYDGVLPTSSSGLLKLPGIGRYTANAIASIAYHECVPAVDGNVCRVLSRLRGIAQTIKSPKLKDRYGWDLAAQILEAGDQSCPGLVNQALMELGASYCNPSGTGIHPHDPLRQYYWSTKLGQAVWDAASTARPIVGGTCRDRTHGASQCAVCAENGIQQAFDSIRDALGSSEARDGSDHSDTVLVQDMARIAGHRAFPLPPEPKVKREEMYAVAAICMQATLLSAPRSSDVKKTKDRQRRWLMVQRPSTGLLASQWEFPSALIWSSSAGVDVVDDDDQDSQSVPTTTAKAKTRPSAAKKKKTQTSSSKSAGAAVPKIHASDRARALDRLLEELDASWARPTRGARSPALHSVPRTALCGHEGGDSASKPLEHVFSHVRHTMWIESGTIAVDSHDDIEDKHLEWTDRTNHRRVRWMTVDEMASIGVTACVLKILKQVDLEYDASIASTSASVRSISSRSGSSRTSTMSSTTTTSTSTRAFNSRSDETIVPSKKKRRVVGATSVEPRTKPPPPQPPLKKKRKKK